MSKTAKQLAAIFDRTYNTYLACELFADPAGTYVAVQQLRELQEETGVEVEDRVSLVLLETSAYVLKCILDQRKDNV